MGLMVNNQHAHTVSYAAQYGRLTVVGYAGETKRGGPKFMCKCSCGNEATVSALKLERGLVISCGCYMKEVRTNKNSEYKIWSSMLDRCRNPKCNRWHSHGARGIKVCERWVSFENFYFDMGARPSSLHSIERVNNSGDYTPSNCVWATSTEQAENRRTTHQITRNGKTQSLKAWCREIGIPYVRTWKRIFKFNWDIERALTTCL